jgi:hypothetical protein
MLADPLLFNGASAFLILGGIYLFTSASKPTRRGIRIVARTTAALLLLIASGLTVIGHPGLLDPRFRPWLALYDDLKPGMTLSEIETAVAHHYPVSGSTMPKPRLVVDSPDSLVFLMDPGPSAAPDCEGIVLSLREDRILGKTYSPD